VSKKIQLVLAEDHQLMRAGLRALIELSGDFEIVGETGDGREVLALVEQAKPDVVLLDIGLPGLSGLEVLPRIVAKRPATKVLIVTGHANEEYVLRALKGGASGYLLKDATTTELEDAIRSVLAGEIYLCPRVSRRVIASYVAGAGVKESALAILSARQREVLQLLAEGKTTKEIAGLLEVSPKTIEAHRAQLMDRLQIHDVPGLVRFAIRTGLVAADS
jgi:DNA-binding NarL/FixJ family response regulator